MQERNVKVLRSLARLFVDEAYAFFITFSQRVSHAVFDAECYVVYSVVAFVKPFLYGAVG